jgi:MFS family permease
LLTCTALAAAGTWFSKHRALAFGIITAGSSLGGVLMPIMVERLIQEAGFGWAMRGVAFLILGVLVVANILIKSRLPPLRKGFKLRDFVAPFSEPPFLVLTIGSFFIYVGGFLPFNFLIAQAKASGMSDDLAGYLIPIVNAASYVLWVCWNTLIAQNLWPNRARPFWRRVWRIQCDDCPHPPRRLIQSGALASGPLHCATDRICRSLWVFFRLHLVNHPRNGRQAV